jgi:hypothetical protein
MVSAVRNSGHRLACARSRRGCSRVMRARRRFRCAAGSDTRVRAAIANGQTPIVPAGSCDIAPGVLAGVRHLDIGVVCIDAPADFNTPHSSVSGSWPGMTLAAVVGDCGEDVWAAQKWHPIATARSLPLGTHPLAVRGEAPAAGQGDRTGWPERRRARGGCRRRSGASAQAGQAPLRSPRPRFARSRGRPAVVDAPLPGRLLAPAARPDAHWHSRALRGGRRDDRDLHTRQGSRDDTAS